MAAPTGYSRDQIRLHWLVVALLGLQFLAHGPIADAMAARAEGAEGFAPLVAAHVFGGLLLFVLVGWRLGLRIFRGVPVPALRGPATHAGLYALLLAMPLTGALAWLSGWEGPAGLHAFLWDALLTLTAIHLALSALRWALLRDDPLTRMRRPEA